MLIKQRKVSEEELLLEEILELGNQAMLLVETKKLDQIFYHGTNEIYKELLPISPNMGNRWESPKWVTYMWISRKNALVWAAQRSVAKRLLDLKLSDEKYRPLEKPYVLGNEDRSISAYILKSQYDKIKELSIGLKCYIYHIKITPKSLGVGHDKSLDEYTSTDKHPKIVDIETVNLTSKLFDEIFIPVSSEEYKRDHNTSTHNNRGILAGLMDDQKTVYAKELYVLMKKKSNCIHPGDDLEQIIEQFIRYQDLFSKFKTIEDLGKWIWQNIEPDGPEEESGFVWPEDIIKHKAAASCMDIAILLHQYCDYVGINSRIGHIGIKYILKPGLKTENDQNHIVCLYKDNKKWCIIQNSGPDRLRKIIFKGNENPKDTLDLFYKAYIPGMIKWLKARYPNMVVTQENKKIADDIKYGEFERKYFESKDPRVHRDKQKIISRLFED